MSICILADAANIDRAKQIELRYMPIDNLKCVSTSSLNWPCLTYEKQTEQE